MLAEYVMEHDLNTSNVTVNLHFTMLKVID